MANYLSKICVGRAPQGVWEDKVHQDAFGIGDRIGLKTFGIMDGWFWESRRQVQDVRLMQLQVA